MADKRMQKVFYFSSLETKELIEECINKESTDRGCSTSCVIEEYVLAGIAKSFPEKKEIIQEIFQRKYKYLDKFLLQNILGKVADTEGVGL